MHTNHQIRIHRAHLSDPHWPLKGRHQSNTKEHIWNACTCLNKRCKASVCFPPIASTSFLKAALGAAAGKAVTFTTTWSAPWDFKREPKKDAAERLPHKNINEVQSKLAITKQTSTLRRFHRTQAPTSQHLQTYACQSCNDNARIK